MLFVLFFIILVALIFKAPAIVLGVALIVILITAYLMDLFE